MRKSSATQILAASALLLMGAVEAFGVAAGGEQVVTTRSPNVCIPGDDSFAWCGDGGPATRARLAGPRAVADFGDGGFLIADSDNHVIRHVFGDGIIWTVAGIGLPGDDGDGGPAIEAELDEPAAVAVLGDGGFLIADSGNHTVRRVMPDGTIVTVAGTGEAGDSGDGGPAAEAELDTPLGLALPGDGSLLIADSGNHRIRRVSGLSGGQIETIAGTGTGGYSGDGGPATAAQLRAPVGIAISGLGGILIADRGNHAIRHVDTAGTMATVLGQRRFPTSVAATSDGSIIFTEQAAVRRLHPDGSVTTVAGTGELGFDLDERPGPESAQATETPLAYPTDADVLPSGDVLVSVRSADRVVRVSGDRVRTVAGAGDVPRLRARAAVKRRGAGQSPTVRVHTVSVRGRTIRTRIQVSREALVSGRVVRRVRARGSSRSPDVFRCGVSRVPRRTLRWLTCRPRGPVRPGAYTLIVTASVPQNRLIRGERKTKLTIR